MVEKFQSEIISIKNITEDVKHFVLTTPDNFTFIPGQYISIVADTEEEKLRRAYSIGSKPMPNKLELCIKIIPDGALTPKLDLMKQGDKLELIGPLGKFILKEESKEKETPKAEEYTKEEHDKKTNAETSKYPMYKSEDIVSKAIELINTAYDEIGKAEEAKKAKGDYCRHCGKKNEKETLTESEQIKIEEEKTIRESEIEDEYENKAEGADGGTATTSTEGTTNFVYSDVHEKKKQEKKDKKQDEDDEGEQQAEQEEMEGEAWHSQYD